MGLFKPAWMSDNKEKALKAVEQETDQAKLAEIAKTAPLDDVRKTAVIKLSNQSILTEIAKNDKSKYVRWAATNKISDPILVERAKKEKEESNHEMEVIIAQAAKNTTDRNMRIKMVGELTNQSILSDFAKNDGDTTVRRTAIEHLTDQAALEYVVKNEKESFLRKMAAEKLPNTSIEKRKVCGTLFNHDWQPDTCKDKCTVCGEERENNDRHQWERIPGTCAGKCKICGKEIENSLSFNFHEYEWVGCQEICKICGSIGKTIPHVRGADCRCSKCGEECHDWSYGESYHPYNTGQAVRDATCKICGKVEQQDYGWDDNW